MCLCVAFNVESDKVHGTQSNEQIYIVQLVLGQNVAVFFWGEAQHHPKVNACIAESQMVQICTIKYIWGTYMYMQSEIPAFCFAAMK